jgi:DNA-directed RNA polymerase subunit RPC12/RpoP
MTKEDLEKKSGFCNKCKQEKTFVIDTQQTETRGYFKCPTCNNRVTRYYLTNEAYQDTLRKMARLRRL